MLISQQYKWPELKTAKAGLHRVLQVNPKSQNLRNARLVK